MEALTLWISPLLGERLPFLPKEAKAGRRRSWLCEKVLNSRPVLFSPATYESYYVSATFRMQ